jgi:hypothetical protein
MINGGGLPPGFAFVAVVLSFADAWLLLMLFDLLTQSWLPAIAFESILRCSLRCAMKCPFPSILPYSGGQDILLRADLQV